MKARRTPSSNQVFRLEGGTEDNDLWVEVAVSDQGPCLRSVWELTPKEREQVAAGANVYLLTWGAGTPPVALGVTDEPLGARRPT